MQSSTTTFGRLADARRIIWRDLYAGIAAVARKGLTTLGIAAAIVVAVAVARPELRPSLAAALGRVGTELAPTADAVAAPARVDAADPAAIQAAVAAQTLAGHPGIVALTNEQRAAANFLVRKYRLAPDAVALLVSEAYAAGRTLRIDPLLILAVMSIESSMNPFAQSVVGAQGLMQVMPDVHAERFQEFGGRRAALDPIANIRVGAEILKELIDRHGSTEAGLKAYVGAALLDDDEGYGARVLGERERLQSAVSGRPVVARPRPADDVKRDDTPGTTGAPAPAAPVGPLAAATRVGAEAAR